MRAWTEKVYMIFGKDNAWNYSWMGQDGSKMHFTWSPKFMVQSLVKIFWPEKWEQVFNDFMLWVEWIKDLEYPWHWKDSPATFVLYKKKRNETKSYKRDDAEEVYYRKEELG